MTIAQTEIFEIQINADQIKSEYSLMNASIEFENKAYCVDSLITTVNNRQAFKCKDVNDNVVFLALLNS